jgi:carboxymethylenebutenolidase
MVDPMDEMVIFGHDSAQVNAIFCRPKLDEAPGVLMFHAWWGLNPFFKATASRMSQEGFAVLAPDYFHGQIATTIDEAKTLRSQMDRKRTYVLAKQALDYLIEQEKVFPKQVAVIGFSLGCGPALELARNQPDTVKAVVLFYGTGGGKFDSSRADFLGHFAEDDQWGAHAKKVESLQKRLLKSGGEVIFYTYPNTQHWFFESDRPESYNEDAAGVAWERTILFLKQKLR